MNESIRLHQQIEFIREIDKLKAVLRQSLLMDASRQENDAEHTWHLAVMAMIMLEYAAEPRPDLTKVIKMLLIHDIVEIDAGDTFAYDEAGHNDKFQREQLAANRIFGLLPSDQGDELMSLWLEFEAGETMESRYAATIDRLQPLLHNYYTCGASWRKHGVRSSQVLKRITQMAIPAPALHDYAVWLVGDAVAKGYLAE
ncbi:HD domain-containing protein [Paenibacillus segetis]|uniref:Hydrolase n=1 Tax=Paenibacillus segetis TaxID=1325360 RepID=A0ABQ1Y8E8_9BACL|nr:HD domain-containing protein [Paenibacillus segetis]GGH16582.1 hydrolase [Paenibacillus segetis]